MPYCKLLKNVQDNCRCFKLSCVLNLLAMDSVCVTQYLLRTASVHFIFCNNFQATNEKAYNDFSSEQVSSFFCINEQYENVILQNLIWEAKSSTFPGSPSVKKQHFLLDIVKKQNHCLQAVPSLFLILRQLLVFAKFYSNHGRASQSRAPVIHTFLCIQLVHLLERVNYTGKKNAKELVVSLQRVIQNAT